MSEFDGNMNNSVDSELYDKYGVLLRNIENYFPTEDDPEDKSDEFINEYRLVGENNIRFAGTEEQLKLAIKRHVEFSQILNEVMGYDLTPNQTNEYMIDLYNRLTDVDETKIRAQKDTDALMDYYVKRPLILPFEIPKFGNQVPLWLALVASILVSVIGWLGHSFLKFPVIESIFMVILIIGTVATFAIAVAMYYLRDEVMNADKYEERKMALQEYREAKKKKNKTSRWRIPGRG